MVTKWLKLVYNSGFFSAPKLIISAHIYSCSSWTHESLHKWKEAYSYSNKDWQINGWVHVIGGGVGLNRTLIIAKLKAQNDN